MAGQHELDVVSVIIPAFNAEATIADTLRSVRSQTYPALDIIVIDDGSTDGTAACVTRIARQDRRIRFLRQANRGVAAARNAGVAIARGAFIAPIDADDLWHPRNVELQMRVFAKSDVPLGFVYAWSRRIDRRGIAMADQGEPRFAGNIFGHLLAFNFLNNASAAIFRKASLLAAGGYDASFRQAAAQGAEDLSLALAIAEKEPVGVVPHYLIGYRNGSGTMSADGARMRRSMELVLRRVEERRPDIPDSLLGIGRMHADLYAASLAFNRRDWRLLAQSLVRGFSRDPISAGKLAAVTGLWRFSDALGLTVSTRNFEDLDPSEPLPAQHFQRWLEAIRATTFRARGTTNLPPTRRDDRAEAA